MLGLTMIRRMVCPAARWGVLLCLFAASVGCVDDDRGRLAAALEASRAHAELLALSIALEQATSGQREALATVRRLEPSLQMRMLALREDDTARRIDAPAETQRDLVDRAGVVWNDIRSELQQLPSLEAAWLDALDRGRKLSTLLPELQGRLESLLQARSEGSESAQVLRCMLLTERMQRRLHEVIASAPERREAIFGLNRDAADLARCLDLLRGPRPALDLRPVEAMARPGGRFEVEAADNTGGAALPTDQQIQTEVDALLAVATALLELEELTALLQPAIKELGALLDELAADR